MSVRSDIKQKLSFLYEKKKYELLDRHITSVGGFAQEILLDYIESNEKLSRYAPYLSEGNVELDHVSIKDAKIGSDVDVYLKDHQLYCEHDRSFDCAHVAFVWSLPMLRLSLKDRGMKPPS